MVVLTCIWWKCHQHAWSIIGNLLSSWEEVRLERLGLATVPFSTLTPEDPSRIIITRALAAVAWPKGEQHHSRWQGYHSCAPADIIHLHLELCKLIPHLRSFSPFGGGTYEPWIICFQPPSGRGKIFFNGTDTSSEPFSPWHSSTIEKEKKGCQFCLTSCLLLSITSKRANGANKNMCHCSVLLAAWGRVMWCM